MVRKWKIRKHLPGVEADSAETEAPRKRRWGTSQLLPTKKPALVISTDSLKVTHKNISCVQGFKQQKNQYLHFYK